MAIEGERGGEKNKGRKERKKVEVGEIEEEKGVD